MTGRSRTRGRVRLVLAAGALCGLLVGTTAAAFSDHAEVPLSAVGGTYDLAFRAPDGSIVQGKPDVYEIDSTDAGPIRVAGSSNTWRVDLDVANAGTTAAGAVTLRLASLLATPPADGDGVVRDPFTVLLASIWVDGEQVAASVPASEVTAAIADWPAGTVRSVTIELAYRTNLDTPFYYGKDVRVGFVVEGTA